MRSDGTRTTTTSKESALRVETAPFETTIGPSVAPGGTVAVIWVSESMLPPAAASPNLTPVAWENPLPVIVTLSPTTPLWGVKEVMASGIVKVPELRAVPATVVSAILPVVAPGGMVALTCVALTGVTFAAATPLKVTPVGPDRFDPLTVTTVPATPLDGLKPEIVGGKITVNASPFETPAAVTTVTAALVAVSGTVTVICESSSTENVDAATAPNLT